jgi:predicted nucleotidyltransferase
VRGDQDENSDVDLIVQFEKGEKGYMKFIRLSEYPEGLFEKKVDLLTDVGISPFIKPKIEEEVIYVSFRS